MATHAQLEAERWWGREFLPPALDELCDRLRAHWGVPATNIGSKGDNQHLSGYHRSRNWVLNSRYCQSRSYSVTETRGNRSGGNGDWLCAVDFKPATLAQLVDACRRLDHAVRAGQLEKVTEWYGTFDGARVVGYDNVANRAASSDASHRWHGHLSFDRGRAGDDHTDVYEILTGIDMATPMEIWSVNAGSSKNPVRAIDRLNQVYALLGTIAEKVDVDPAELEAIKAAAREGAAAGREELIAAVVAALPSGASLTRGDVEEALRSVLRAGVGG